MVFLEKNNIAAYKLSTQYTNTILHAPLAKMLQ